MVVGFIAGLVATVLVLIVGITAGYIGGRTDEGLSLTANVFLAIPGLPLLIVIDSSLPASARSNTLLIGFIIAITGWAWGARVLRAETLSVKRRDFVEAARVVGEGRARAGDRRAGLHHLGTGARAAAVVADRPGDGPAGYPA